MSCIQAAACKPSINVFNKSHPRTSSTPCIAPVNILHFPKNSPVHFTRLPKVSLGLTTSASRYQQRTPVCLFGGKGKPANNNEDSPWKSLEKAMGGLKKEQSLEDILRQQMEKQEYYDDGGSGGNRPGGGGGDGSDGPEDDGIWDEVLQVVLATVGIIFLYLLIIDGEDIIVFARDMIRFLFTRQKSFRLNRIFYQWGRFYQRLHTKEEIEPYWLEKAIVGTPTWWDSPEKYKRILTAYLASLSKEEEEEKEED